MDEGAIVKAAESISARIEDRNPKAFWMAVLALEPRRSENEAESWYELDHSDRNAMWDVEFGVCCRDSEAKRPGVR